MIVGPDNFVINRLPAVFLVVVLAIIVYHSWAACAFRKQYQALKNPQADDSATNGTLVWLSTGDLVSRVRVCVCVNTTSVHDNCCPTRRQYWLALGKTLLLDVRLTM